MTAPRREYYGGQALIEGVMIRSRRHLAVAVRRPDGTISLRTEALSPFYTGPWAQLPLLRGIIALAEALALGARELLYSAAVATGEEGAASGGSLWGVLGLGLAFGVALFFLLPLFLVGWIDPYLASDLLSNIVEGLFRLSILWGYLALIGRLAEIQRLFAYHGAEHKAVHAYEAGVPLEVTAARPFSTAHPRCGTAFLLTVVVVAVVVFAFLGRPPFLWRLLSRVALVPLIAALSYELIRFAAAHWQHWGARLLAAPGLYLQNMTTREPDDAQLEVALTAMQGALKAEEGPFKVHPEA